MSTITLLDAIEAILRPGALEPGPIRLVEEQCPGFDPVEITRSGRVVVVRPDATSLKECPRQDCPSAIASQDRLYPLFKTDMKDLTRSCDRIIFYQPRSNSPLYVLLIELKQGGRGSRRQLQNTRLLAEYIVATARLHHHGQLQAVPEICYRGIVFTPLAKTTGKQCSYVDAPGPLPDIKYAHLQNTRYDIRYFCDQP